MNTKNNKRAQESGEKIIRAFFAATQKKPVNKVTVREICELAEINRSTFYAHYKDVYDVMEQVEKTMAKELTQSFLSRLDTSMESCFLSMFEFIKEYREFYKIYLNNTEKSSGILQLATETYQDKVAGLSYQELGYRFEEEIAYHEDFFLSGFSALVRRWVNRDCKESPRELYGILNREYHQRQELFQWGEN